MLALFGAAALLLAQHEVFTHAEEAGLNFPIAVVETASPLCPDSDVPKPCNAWITWSNVGWIISFTPEGLKQKPEDLSRTAAHEVCHIIHHARLLRTQQWGNLDELSRLREEGVAGSCADLRMQARKAHGKEVKK